MQVTYNDLYLFLKKQEMQNQQTNKKRCKISNREGKAKLAPG